MRIFFTTNHVTAASTVLNEANVRRMGEMEGVTIDVHRRDYANYDVVLFMGPVIDNQSVDEQYYSVNE